LPLLRRGLSNGDSNATAGSRAPPVLADERIIGRNKRLQNSLRNGSRVQRAMDLLPRLPLLRRALSNGASNGTAGSRAPPALADEWIIGGTNGLQNSLRDGRWVEWTS
jgi:hypothetical protein